MAQDGSRRLKKGDKLLSEGDAGTALFFVQSGKLRTFLERGGRSIEVGVVGAQQVIGDQWLFSQAKSVFSVEALQETHLLEIPIDVLKGQLEKANPALKLIVKSMADELKGARHLQRSKALEGDSSPMPLSQMAKSLSLIHLSARHLGKSLEEGVEVDWNLFRQSLQRFFMEPSSRLKQWMLLFKKKGLARFEVKVDEDGEEDFGKILLTDLQVLEDFAEFYQHYYFKSPAHELISFEDTPYRVARVMVELGEGRPVDHRKATGIEVKELNEAYKKAFGAEFKTSFFDHLERKGLFVKRQSFDDGRLMISFDHSEFSKVVSYWGLLKEVVRWNELGEVDMSEEKIEGAGGGSALLCPSCEASLHEEHRFCPQCGFKLAA